MWHFWEEKIRGTNWKFLVINWNAIHIHLHEISDRSGALSNCVKIYAFLLFLAPFIAPEKKNAEYRRFVIESTLSSLATSEVMCRHWR